MSWAQREDIIDGQRKKVESRQLMAGYRHGLRCESGLGQAGNVTDGHGMIWDVTFHH
jgi:hypothetical protein